MTNNVMVKMVIDSWNAQVNNVNKLIDTFTDEQWNTEVSLNRNRGIYLLGHLVAVNDRMLPLLGFGEQAFPHLYDVFAAKPDKAVEDLPTLDELKRDWHQSVKTLATLFNNLTPEEWFAKHTAVSEEDFAKEPHRNRMNVILSRTNHLAYHLGQLNLLKK